MKWSEVTWWSILGICALHLTHPSAHTQQWTHTRSSRQPMLRRPGSSWGFSALLKGLTSVMVLKVERALVIHSTDNSCRTWDSNPRPRVTSPTLYPLGHDCPQNGTYTLVSNWNHCRISGDVHFAGHLRSNRTNVVCDKRNIWKVQSRGVQGLGLGNAALKAGHVTRRPSLKRLSDMQV